MVCVHFPLQRVPFSPLGGQGGPLLYANMHPPLYIYAYQHILGAMHIYRTPSIFSIFSILAYLTCYAYISNPPYTQHIQHTSISQVLCIYIDPHLYLAYQHISGAMHIYRPPLYFAYLAYQHISGAMHIYRPPSIFSIFSIYAYLICKYAKYMQIC